MFAIARSKDSYGPFSMVYSLYTIAMNCIMSNAFIVLLGSVSMGRIFTRGLLINCQDRRMASITVRCGRVISVQATYRRFILLWKHSSRTFFAISVRFFINFRCLNNFSNIRITRLYTAERIFTVFLFRRPMPLSNVFRSVNRIIISLNGVFIRTNGHLFNLIKIRLRSAPRLSLRRTRSVILYRFTCRL